MGSYNKTERKSKNYKNFLHLTSLNHEVVVRGGSRTAATSKMERFVVIVDGWWSLLQVQVSLPQWLIFLFLDVPTLKLRIVIIVIFLTSRPKIISLTACKTKKLSFLCLKTNIFAKHKRRPENNNF